MRTIPQRELRNRSGEILRQVESGEQFTITMEGRPVAVLGPYQKRQWISREELLKILRTQPADPALLEDVREMAAD
ncbi:MAG TPA: type II toxin-antitoxin system prevent-host-death family antitoxin [Thermoanaerobaculia bacterium]|nr:type II toxin-antitoxin system prevent-host-death family antitoxin [Thermoanaerobaculia bacterium]